MLLQYVSRHSTLIMILGLTLMLIGVVLSYLDNRHSCYSITSQGSSISTCTGHGNSTVIQSSTGDRSPNISVMTDDSSTVTAVSIK